MSEQAQIAMAIVTFCIGGDQGDGGGEPYYRPVQHEQWKCGVIAHWPQDEWFNAACTIQGESEWIPTAYNPAENNSNGHDDAGILQINGVHGLSRAERNDIGVSVRWALNHQQWRVEHGYHPWTPWYAWQKHCRDYQSEPVMVAKLP